MVGGSMIAKDLEKYLSQAIGVELFSGRYVFGVLSEISDFSIKIEFLNKARVLTIPLNSIISVRYLDDDEVRK